MIRPKHSASSLPPGTLLAAILCLSALAACQQSRKTTGPVWDDDPPVQTEGGSFEAVVVRHSGPVYVVRPGAASGYPLPFYRKRERVRSGSGVRVGAGGRAELLWHGDATSITLFDDGAAVLGDPGRDEPLVRIERLTRAQLLLTSEDRVVLPGGAELRGDPAQPTGPFFFEYIEPQLVRAKNQSKRRASIHYLDTRLELAPGDSIDLPILAAGSDPQDVDPGEVELVSQGMTFEIVGRVEPTTKAGAVRLRALGPVDLSAQGVRLQLEPGQEAVFSSFQARVPERGGDEEPVE